MAFKRWGQTFDGPWPNTDILKQRAGIWVVWRRTGTRWEVLEVGESKNVRQSLLDRSSLFECPHDEAGEIHYSATYTPDLSDEARRETAQRIDRIARPKS